MAVDVRVSWFDDGGNLDDGFWHASWEETESESEIFPNGQDLADLVQITTTAQGEDLGELVEEIVESIGQEWPDSDVTIVNGS